jgi:hypothetical protein
MKVGDRLLIPVALPPGQRAPGIHLDRRFERPQSRFGCRGVETNLLWPDTENVRSYVKHPLSANVFSNFEGKLLALGWYNSLVDSGHGVFSLTA